MAEISYILGDVCQW